MKEIDLMPSVFTLNYIDLVTLSVFDRDTTENAAFVAFIESNVSHSNSIIPLLVLDPDEGVNQSMSLRAENLTALLEQVGKDFFLTVIAIDSIRNKRTRRSISPLDPIMQDVGRLHLSSFVSRSVASFLNYKFSYCYRSRQKNVIISALKYKINFQ